MSKTNKKKVYVGVSGGVDSSVSAHLLKKAGHDVTGVFIRVWYPDFLECDWKDERSDAMRVCAQLGIPFKELDLEDVYKREVADYMISEYKKGRTPNPDVMCNKHVKFGGFLKWALEDGADMVATGHYARIARVESQNSKVKTLSPRLISLGLKKAEVSSHKNKPPLTTDSDLLSTDSNLRTTDHQLLTGLDTSKDQSYFLWTLTESQLSKTIFPVGDLPKSKVREIAASAGLLTAEKKDSQGVCFLGEISMKEFLKKYIETEKGNVLNEEGEVIGHHEGALLYTIGERRGFTITAKTPNDKPYFVVSKDIESNTITVSDELENSSSLFNAKEVLLTSTNWISEIKERAEYKARIRYRQTLQDCTVEGERVVFKDTQKAVAVGQSVVVYDGDICVGGGIVESIVS